MRSRLELQDLLESIAGNHNVYFQPPASVSMKYPAIWYTLNGIPVRRADDGVYHAWREYTLTVIYKDPDCGISEAVAQLPYCSFDRHYAQDNLNHDVFTLHF